MKAGERRLAIYDRLKNEKFIERSRKYNTYDLSGDYGIGYTEEGNEFSFDLEDYDKIKNYYWNIDNKGYILYYILL